MMAAHRRDHAVGDDQSEDLVVVRLLASVGTATAVVALIVSGRIAAAPP